MKARSILNVRAHLQSVLQTHKCGPLLRAQHHWHSSFDGLPVPRTLLSLSTIPLRSIGVLQNVSCPESMPKKSAQGSPHDALGALRRGISERCLHSSNPPCSPQAINKRGEAVFQLLQAILRGAHGHQV